MHRRLCGCIKVGDVLSLIYCFVSRSIASVVHSLLSFEGFWQGKRGKMLFRDVLLLVASTLVAADVDIASHGGSWVRKFDNLVTFGDR